MTHFAIKTQHLNEENGILFTTLTSRIAFLEFELEEIFSIKSSDYSKYITSAAIMENLTDDEILYAISYNMVCLPVGVMDRVHFAKELDQLKQQIEKTNIELNQISVSTFGQQSTCFHQRPKILLKQKIGILQTKTYELTKNHLVDIRKFYSEVGPMLKEMVDCYEKKSLLLLETNK